MSHVITSCPLCGDYQSLDMEKNPDRYDPYIYCEDCSIQVSGETFEEVLDKWGALTPHLNITFDPNTQEVIGEYQKHVFGIDMSKKSELLLWFLQLSFEAQIKIINPHYAKWYNDQQVELEKVRGD